MSSEFFTMNIKGILNLIVDRNTSEGKVANEQKNDLWIQCGGQLSDLEGGGELSKSNSLIFTPLNYWFTDWFKMLSVSDIPFEIS